MSTARAVGGAVADRGAGFSVAAPIRRIAALRRADVASASAAISAAGLPNAGAPLVASRATASRNVSTARAVSAPTVVAPVTNAATAQALYVDTTNPGQGGVYAGASYNVANGDTYTSVYDGYSGTGTITHSAGTLTIPMSGSLYVGYNSGSNGSYSLSGTGNLSTGTTYVGNSGTGTFNQSGGSFTANSGTANVASLNVAYNSGSNGTYSLSGATSTLFANGITIGSSGAGTFSQSGGLFSSDSNTLTLGANGTGSGTYVLSGGSLYADVVVIGSAGMGTFTQSAGTFVSAGSVTLGSAASGSGTYSLNGGTLDVAEISGGSGTSTFNFNGGTLQADGSSTSFFAGLSVASVQANGATINTANSNVTIAQNLVSGTPAGTLDGGLSKLGAGTLTLSGTNTYTGPTSVGVGVLEAANPASLPGYNSAGKVTVSSGATLAASVGGAGQWTAAELDTLRGNVTFNGGAALGIDTASATAPSPTPASSAVVWGWPSSARAR